MVQRIIDIIQDYQDRLHEIPCVPKTFYRRDSVGYCGDANKLFLTFLFRDHATSLQFLKDVGLIRSKVQCNSCGRDMTWYADPSVLDGFRWRCRMVAGTMCSGSRSIRHGSFQRRNLILHGCTSPSTSRRETAEQILRERYFSHHTIADCDIFCRDNACILEGLP